MGAYQQQGAKTVIFMGDEGKRLPADQQARNQVLRLGDPASDQEGLEPGKEGRLVTGLKPGQMSGPQRLNPQCAAG